MRFDSAGWLTLGSDGSSVRFRMMVTRVTQPRLTLGDNEPVCLVTLTGLVDVGEALLNEGVYHVDWTTVLDSDDTVGRVRPL